MNRTKTIFLLVFSFISIIQLYNPLIGSAEQYLCVVEKTTGFKYNKASKSWESVNFTAGTKYIISKDDTKLPVDYSRFKFTVKEMGDKHPLYWCEDDFGLDILSCTGPGDFRFNRENGRFVLAFTAGYYNVGIEWIIEITDENSDTPLMSIGKCSSF